MDRERNDLGYAQLVAGDEAHAKDRHAQDPGQPLLDPAGREAKEITSRISKAPVRSSITPCARAKDVHAAGPMQSQQPNQLRDGMFR